MLGYFHICLFFLSQETSSELKKNSELAAVAGQNGGGVVVNWQTTDGMAVPPDRSDYVGGNKYKLLWNVVWPLVKDLSISNV